LSEMQRQVDPVRLTFMIGVLLLVLFFPIGIPLTLHAGSRYRRAGNPGMAKLANKLVIVTVIIVVVLATLPIVEFLFA
jgi:hypothetical protein